MGQETDRNPVDENIINRVGNQHRLADGSAVIAAVEEREVELRTELLLARQQAEEIIAKARSEAESIREAALTTNTEDRQTFTAEALGEAKNSAAAGSRKVSEQLDLMNSEARKNFKQAVDYVVRAVLPVLPSGGDKNVTRYDKS